MAFASPEINLSELPLTAGLKVADFGAGSGAYALALARAVGDSGKVYAVEVQKELLTRLEREALSARLTNIVPQWGDIEVVGGSKLRDQSVDLVLMSNILFQLAGSYSAGLEAKRILKPEGKLAIIEWDGAYGGLGPLPDKVVRPETAKQIMTEAGFNFMREFSAGDHHYGLIFNLQS